MFIHICKQPGCAQEFEAESSQKIYCPVCTEVRKIANKKRQKQQNKSAKKDLPILTGKQRKVLITDEEQYKINVAVALKNHVPPDPGRVIIGEEFARLAAFYENQMRR